MKNKKQIIEAHRGASGYCYQNTIESFDKAVELNADAIELDIRITKDLKIVVVHDPTFLNVYINDWKYDDLLKNAKEKQNFEIPLLIDVLKKYKGKILLDIEIKEEGYEEEIVREILSILDVNEFQIRSFSESVIKKIKMINSNIFTILLIGNQYVKWGILGRIPEVFPKGKIKRSNCDAVSPNYRLLILGFIKRMHRINKPVFAWTVNNEKIMKKLLKRKIDGIVTDYPDIAIHQKNILCKR